MTPLDIVTLGRSSVDLYGSQAGGRLEDMGSFEKYVGGSPTNMAIGAARLGLRAAVITAVGDEHMGRFIREQLDREGVETAGVKVDPARLTALIVLGIRDHKRFPMVFYRHDCADMGLTAEDVDPALVARARAVVATGTHLSTPGTRAATLRMVGLARARGTPTALDIDYRPPLWGLGSAGDGESRFVADAGVTGRLASVLDLFDLIVGTEEEFHIAGGTTDTVMALRAVRAATDAGADLQARPARRGGADRDRAGRPVMTASRGRASRSRSTTCWARATASWPGSCGAGWTTRPGARRSASPTPAARWP